MQMPNQRRKCPENLDPPYGNRFATNKVFSALRRFQRILRQGSHMTTIWTGFFWRPSSLSRLLHKLREIMAVLFAHYLVKWTL